MNLKKQGIYVKALEERPVLILGLDFYLRAYSELLFDVSGGFGSGYISQTSIRNWCHSYGIYDIDEIDYVSRHIRALERHDLRLHDQKKAKKT